MCLAYGSLTSETTVWQDVISSWTRVGLMWLERNVLNWQGLKPDFKGQKGDGWVQNISKSLNWVLRHRHSGVLEEAGK